MAAVYYQQNEIGFRHTGITVNVPNNNIARLMYYLGCVCTAVECEQDSDIRRFTNYANWARLSIEEQKVLLGLCYTFSPDVLDDKVFFHSEALCGDSANDFLEISQVRNQLLAAESIVIAGQTREVNMVMVYTMQWMRKNYLEPMQGLAAKLSSLNRPAITYTPPPRPTYTPTYTSNYGSTPDIYEPSNTNFCCCCDKACAIGSICGFLFVLAFVIGFVIYYFVRK